MNHLGKMFYPGNLVVWSYLVQRWKIDIRLLLRLYVGTFFMRNLKRVILVCRAMLAGV